MKGKICTWVTEVLAVSLLSTKRVHLGYSGSGRPVVAAKTVCYIICSVVARLQTQHPKACMAISGDFNQVTLSAALPTLPQFVNCSTRENKKLDLFYANVKDAYSSSALCPLGTLDNNLVFLISN